MQQSKGWKQKAKEVAETQDSKNQKSLEVLSASQKVVRWRWGFRRRCMRGREEQQNCLPVGGSSIRSGRGGGVMSPGRRGEDEPTWRSEDTAIRQRAPDPLRECPSTVPKGTRADAYRQQFESSDFCCNSKLQRNRTWTSHVKLQLKACKESNETQSPLTLYY